MSSRREAKRTRRRLWLGLVSPLVLALCLQAAESPPDAKPEAKKTEGKPEVPVVQGIDALKLPAGAVIVVCENAKDGLGLLPKFIVMTPEEHQKLHNQIEQLKSQLKPDKPVTPAACRMTGKVEGDLLHLKAEFDFVTSQDRASVSLGCTQGKPTGVALDGRLPMLQYGNDGFVVQADKAGEHHLVLDLDMSLVNEATKGNERGFKLDLPTAAITTLELLDLPDAVKDVRLASTLANDRTSSRTLRAVAWSPDQATAQAKHSRADAGALGPVKRLDLAWKGPVAAPEDLRLLAAEGQISIQVDEASISTRAELTLKVLRGQTDEWNLQVPPGAVLEVVKQPEDDRGQATVTEPSATLRTIKLRERSAEALQVVIRVSRDRAGAMTPVGPFAVLGAFRQGGGIVFSAPADLRLRYQPHGVVSQREPTAEEQRVYPRLRDAFTYWCAPVPDKPAQPLPAILDVEVEKVKGTVGTEVAHTVQLTERNWQVSTTIKITSAGADPLQIRLPQGYQLDETTGIQSMPPIQAVERDADPQVLRITFPKQVGELKPTTLTLDGSYPAPDPEVRQATLELPQPLNTVDRGGQVTVKMPDRLELVLPGKAEDPTRDRHQHSWTAEQTPERVAITWRPYRPELPVDSLADVTLEGRQAHVHQRLTFHFPEKPVTQILLRIPEGLANRVGIVEGGKAEEKAALSEKTGSWTWPVTLTGASGKEQTLVLEYSFRLPERHEAPFAVPLVLTDQATGGETKVRVWSEPATEPELTSGPWETRAPEADSRHNTLTALVLRGSRPDLPPSLRVRQLPGTAGATVVLERALIRVAVDEGGYQTYRASYLLNQPRVHTLDIEMPVPLAGFNLRVARGDGRELRWEPLDDGKTARVQLDADADAKPVVLHLLYQIPPGRTGGNGLLQTTLHPPLLHGTLGHAPVRWQVELPPGWVPLYQDGVFAAGYQWGRRGWLLAPFPAVTGDEMERWFAGHDGAARSEEGEPAGTPSFACWRTSLEPLRLHHAPQRAWLLICSLLFLLVGLALSFLPLARGWFWLAVIGLAAAAGAVGLLWPGVLSAFLYGCEPGAVVFVVVLGVQWTLQQRYRRRLVFMPGFTRLKAGSSIIRGGRPRHEPSTVDAPPAPGGQGSAHA